VDTGANLLNEVTLVSLFRSGSHFIRTAKDPAAVVAGVVEGATKGLGIMGINRCQPRQQQVVASVWEEST